MQKERKRTEEVRHQSANSFFPAYFKMAAEEAIFSMLWYIFPLFGSFYGEISLFLRVSCFQCMQVYIAEVRLG